MAETDTPDVVSFDARFSPILKPITHRIPPDYSLLEQALQDGLDINVYDSDAEYAIDQETLLSKVLRNYAYDLETEEYPCLPDIVRWFLEHGYDVHANNEFHGVVAMDAFVYPSSIDKYTLEAARVLLQAGVNTNVQAFPDDFDAEYTTSYCLTWAHYGDNRGLTEDDLEAANYFYALLRMMDCRNEGLDYSGIYHYAFAVGRKIQDILVQGEMTEKTDFHGNVHPYSFKHLYLDCEGMLLHISGEMEFIIEPMPEKEDAVPVKSCAEAFSSIIGKTIEKIEYRYCPDPVYTSYSLYESHILLEGGLDMVVAEAYMNEKPPWTWIRYIELRQV